MAGFRARAPCRVDLLGGTLDVAPLPALLGQVTTVNAAVTIHATAEVRPAGAWTLDAADIAASATAPDLRDIPADHAVRLLRTACLHAGDGVPPSHVRTASAAPPKSGLGGSSAMLIALLAALDRCRGADVRPEALPGLAGAIEAHVLQAPTGLQDYFPAVWGGVAALVFGIGDDGGRRLAAPHAPEPLEARLVVAYTGLSHASGDLNWRIVRAALDGDPAVRGRLERINAIAVRGARALHQGDWPELGLALDADWAERRHLGPGIATPASDRMLDAARAAGALGARLCGAGGGGCLVALAPPVRRPAVEAALAAAGARLLPCGVDRRGLVVEPLPDGP